MQRNGKDKKLWNRLFSPPCPNCGSLRTEEELRDIPVVGSMAELLKRYKKQMEGKPLKPIRTWKCLDCGTTFDEKGGRISFVK